MWNARLDEAQAGIKIAGRNINNLGYADDTILMAESEELMSLLMTVKDESEKFVDWDNISTWHIKLLKSAHIYIKCIQCSGFLHTKKI